MGKLVVSTPFTAAWLPWCGVPTYQGQPTDNVNVFVTSLEIRPEDDFVDAVMTSNGLFGLRANGELWANSMNVSPYLGIDWTIIGGPGTTNTQGDTFTATSATNVKKMFANVDVDGIFFVDTDGHLFYAGSWFKGCGVVEPADHNATVQITQVGTLNDWLTANSYAASHGYSRVAFNMASGEIRVAGYNTYGGWLGEAYWNDSSASSDTFITYTTTHNAIAEYTDGWHTGTYFLTSSGELYLTEMYSGTPDYVTTLLVDTNVKEVHGGGQNWFICYSKVDGSVWRAESITNPQPLQIDPGPLLSVTVDPYWGTICMVRADYTCDVYTEPGVDPVVDVFPGVPVSKVTSMRQFVVGVTYTPPALGFKDTASTAVPTPNDLKSLYEAQGTYNVTTDMLMTHSGSIRRQGSFGDSYGFDWGTSQQHTPVVSSGPGLPAFGSDPYATRITKLKNLLTRLKALEDKVVG